MCLTLTTSGRETKLPLAVKARCLREFRDTILGVELLCPGTFPSKRVRKINQAAADSLLQYYRLVQTASSELPKGRDTVLNTVCSNTESRYKRALTLRAGTLGVAGSVRKNISL
jgi:hypothetical protein